MTGKPGLLEKGSAGRGYDTGMDVARWHQVDSRAAAVNTNNREYRSVNCVLGSTEGGCVSAGVLLRRRSARPILSLYPPFIPCLANFFSAVLQWRCIRGSSRRISRRLLHTACVCSTGRSTRYALCQTRVHGRPEITILI